VIISYFDYSGNILKPWAEAGYHCIAVDKAQGALCEERDGIVYVRADVLTISGIDSIRSIVLQNRGNNKWHWLDEHVKLVFAFPPCTHLASSGALHFKNKGLKTLIKALTLVDKSIDLCEENNCPWMIENPVGMLSTYWRKPDFTFDPCDFGLYDLLSPDDFTKRTCIWTGGGFKMPECQWIHPAQGSKIVKMSPSISRQDERSETPMGFARAIFERNHSEINS
jgi:hypothetical protein